MGLGSLCLSLSLSLSLYSFPDLASPGLSGRVCIPLFSLLKATSPSPSPFQLLVPTSSLRPEALWEETRCGARAARGEARSAGPSGRSQWGAWTAARAAGGRGRGAISAGAARRPPLAVERSRPARRCREPGRRAGGRAGRRARGGARAAGEARRAPGGGGGGKRSARGCGSRTPRPRRLLQEEPRGHCPCPRPASGHLYSSGAPRGLASVKVSGGWGRLGGGGPAPFVCGPTRGAHEASFSYAGLAGPGAGPAPA